MDTISCFLFSYEITSMILNEWASVLVDQKIQLILSNEDD